MNSVVGVSAHNGLRLAEVGFLLIVLAGVWLVAADQLRLHRARTTVAGFALAAGGVLLIVAVHWGHFS